MQTPDSTKFSRLGSRHHTLYNEATPPRPRRPAFEVRRAAHTAEKARKPMVDPVSVCGRARGMHARRLLQTEDGLKTEPVHPGTRKN